MQNKQDNSQVSPLVTFIIAYYNLPAEMLCECLDSILALTLRRSDRQIIVVDDGSDQSPLEELSQYLDDIVYLRQPNAGLSEARNSGMLMAKGQYIQFVDADDLLLQSPYEHCLDIVRFKQPDIVMFDFTDGTENDDNATFNTEDLRSGTEYLSQHNLQATAWGYLFKRNMIGNLRFTPGIFHEDEEFTPQLLLRAESVLATDAKAYFYRHRPHSITTEEDKRKVVKRISDKLLIIKKLHRIADTMPSDERLALNRRVAQLTMDYIYNIITQTRDRQFLDRKLEQLRQEGLFPLPDRDYTTKYKWFRLLSNSSIGLSLLMNVLPMINKER